ncbi:MAG TPA: hypothetical protein PKG95_11380 [Anaerolineaceae bacterium]|nr:hypothetical protein [Anaerolineaceae bacterium]
MTASSPHRPRINLQRFSNSRFAVSLMLTLSQLMPRWLGRRLVDLVARLIVCQRETAMVQAIRANQWVLSGGTLSAAELNARACQVIRSSGNALFDHYHNVRTPNRARHMVQFTPHMLEIIAERKQARQGAVFVAPHTGSFDLAGMALVQAGLKFLVLSFPQPPGGYQLQNELRRLSGIEIMPLTMEALQSARQRLQNGGTVLTGLDRPWPESTHRPRFFGRPTALPVAYIPLALRNKVPVYFVYCLSQPKGRYVLNCSEPIWLQSHPDRDTEVIANAEQILRLAEAVLSAHPEQWAMTYPVWPETLDQIPS